ncbi:MAG: hypothetical protein JXQ72_15440, partial [Anaerolineae bacterium]|nr:hypothetical protein [Anaerolineae bacterium]
ESPQAGEAFALDIVVENVGGARAGDYAVHIDFIDTGRSETLPVAVIERNGLDAGAEDIAFSSDIRRVENSGSFQVQVVIVPAGEDASPQNNTQRKAFIVQ